MNNYSLNADLKAVQAHINQVLENRLDQYQDFGSPLIKAMKYSALLGGKRVRPFLMYKTTELFGVPTEKVDSSAVALEAIHAYSLAHDDLPAMDNDTLRRGQPTCHIAFDEATAILAGDSLQTFAFEQLAEDSLLSASEKVAQIATLAKFSGARGMCLGQSLDLEAEHKAVPLEHLELIHRNKTGALILAAVEMGLNLANVNSKDRSLLQEYAKLIGLAFQVQDDILDVVGEAEKTGKHIGSDANLNKSTYVKLLGLDGAKQKAAELHKKAIDCLNQLSLQNSTEIEPLVALADFIVNRES